MANSAAGARRKYDVTQRRLAMAGTKEQILAAARSRFLSEPYEDVTLNDVADDAGVTKQTVLNHFGSKGELFLAAAESTGPFRAEYDGSSVEDAVEFLVDEYEVYGDTLVRLLLVEHRVDELGPFLSDGRANHTRWVEKAFSQDLPGDPDHRTLVVHAVAAALDVHVWKVLRRDRGLPVDTVVSILNSLVRGALQTQGQTQTGEEKT